MHAKPAGNLVETRNSPVEHGEMVKQWYGTRLEGETIAVVDVWTTNREHPKCRNWSDQVAVLLLFDVVSCVIILCW